MKKINTFIIKFSGKQNIKALPIVTITYQDETWARDYIFSEKGSIEKGFIEFIDKNKNMMIDRLKIAHRDTIKNQKHENVDHYHVDHYTFIIRDIAVSNLKMIDIVNGRISLNLYKKAKTENKLIRYITPAQSLKYIFRFVKYNNLKEKQQLLDLERKKMLSLFNKEKKTLQIKIKAINADINSTKNVKI